MTQAKGTLDQMPLCPVHQKIDANGTLELPYGNACVACSLCERQELLDLLAPLAIAAAGPRRTSVDFLQELLDQNHHYPGEGSPWMDFLHHRARVLVEFEEDGKSPEESARILSMDPGQVRLILMAQQTPNG